MDATACDNRACPVCAAGAVGCGNLSPGPRPADCRFPDASEILLSWGIISPPELTDAIESKTPEHSIITGNRPPQYLIIVMMQFRWAYGRE